MTRYAAFLRAVNLGPTRKVPMARVRELLSERLGYTEVSTYIASGNVLFTGDGAGSAADARRHAAALREVLSADAGFDVPAIVYPASALKEVLRKQPFHEADPRQVTVVLMQGGPPAALRAQVATLAEAAVDGEGLQSGRGALYVHLPRGIQGSALVGAVARAAPASTMRTLATVSRVAERLGEGAAG